MNLVWKETPRGRFHRELNFAERMAIFHVVSRALTPTTTDLLLAKKVFTEMDTKDLLIECDCLNEAEKGPYNCEVKSATLRHLMTSPEHDRLCPLFRMKKRRDADGTDKEAKASPLNPVGGDDWLPDETDKGTVTGLATPGGKQAKRRKSLKPVPAIGRKLLTLIQAAGLNQLELLSEKITPGLMGALNRVKDVVSTSSMENGIPLSAIISCNPWLTISQISEAMETLASDSKIKDENKAVCFYIVGLTRYVTHEEIRFTVKGTPYPHKPAARVRINGENSYNPGSRPPYWAIIEYRFDDNGSAYCHEGYAHAAYDLDNPVPVDSNKERDTLKTILNASEFVGKCDNSPSAMSLLKPLFTLKSGAENEVVHPDFMLNVVPAGRDIVGSIIIETMGSDSEEYIQRKAGTHQLMRQLGDLITDPPGWPQPSTVTFNKLLLAHIFNVGK
ncbi:hypothetical protein RJE46_25145 (plasmid) [Cedecea neteri]|uniref:hypothetical protein n=1 Tax=Cedecea neteri TaxID=158822 RepID=UPI002892BA83|nr:hypothetical protein [Cedecea neteri]WNJ82227.1 hypothetical protein RJE46_25145 [Cedecea neteri]